MDRSSQLEQSSESTVSVFMAFRETLNNAAHQRSKPSLRYGSTTFRTLSTIRQDNDINPLYDTAQKGSEPSL